MNGMDENSEDSDDSYLDPPCCESVDHASDSDCSETSDVLDYYPALTPSTVAKNTVSKQTATETKPTATVSVSENSKTIEAEYDGATHTHPSESEESIIRDKNVPLIYI